MRGLVVAFSLVVAIPAVASPEVYRYEARPTDVDPGARGEHARVEIVREGDGYRYRSTGSLPDGTLRETEVVTGAGGQLLRATERLAGGRTVRTIRVGADHRVRWEERTPDGVHEKRWKVPPDRVVAADASLVLLARGVACGESSVGREVWVVDFSGRTIQGSLHPLPAGRITLPIGAYAVCPVDFVFRVLLFRSRIHLWLARDPPRFLVRQIGKRTPLGSRWHTVLAGVGDGPG